MPSINRFLGLLEQLQSADISVNQQRCAVVRHRNAGCMRCAEACTSGCISYDDDEGIRIAPERCIGCGTCATVCPTCALEAHNPTDKELLAECLNVAQATGGRVTIACERLLQQASGLYDPGKVVSVTCLGRVEEALLVSMAAFEVESVVLVDALCDGCEHDSGRVTAEWVAENAQVLLDVWHSPMELKLAAKLPRAVKLDRADAGYDVGRREFFTNVKEETKAAAQTTAEFAVKDALGVEEVAPPRYVKVGADGTLPHHVPGRRGQLLRALKMLGEPDDEMIGTRLWGHVIIDADVCNSCQMCATFCPTGALRKFSELDGTFGVGHAPSKCVKCRVCEDICPPGAISISDEVFAVDLLRGVVERYEMRPRKNQQGPHQILHSMRDMLKCDQVYEG
ncbi:indolepyruvate ferredoxin oxidoreductase subunit alpha [Xiamenia xianingshaonis]|uniref:4Fe-4S binding protein n=1 Tax=Xiamenia xianingshaonis TaxID=2682776 RepID=A0A9E6SU90_9ACTN|nr:4Fe-4S binding protein [Xiamenia xianingshaonis]NHM14959.1 4Fe-4S dicluster domain-containing protein [Xiamenia xianingshaonis]QTU84022.1 4Fe-4S binding protein [Xiamenia xianingshaonis]